MYAKPHSLAQHILQIRTIKNSFLVSEEAVNNDNHIYCDNHNYLNITWPMTSKGNTALSPCPGGARGTF